MKALHVLYAMFGALLLTLAACGPADTVGRVVPVKGQVTVDGKPANHGGVVFYPDAAKGNTSKFECAGKILEDGTYTLHTNGKPGAPPGAYKVTVVIQAKADSSEPTKAVLEVPEKYAKKEKTPLAVEVVETPTPGLYDLKVVQ